MSKLPDEIMVWHGSFPLQHTGIWATTRYPESAVRYVPKREPESNACDGERCDCCGRNYRVVYRVENDIWAKIAPSKETLGVHPEHQFGGLLCPDCASAEAEKIGIVLRFNGCADTWPA